MSTKTFYVAGFTNALNIKFYVFNHEGKAWDNAKPLLLADEAEAWRLARQASATYPLHATPFVNRVEA